MSKLSSFVLTVRRGVAVGTAVVAGTAIIPCSPVRAALDGGSPPSITSIPRGATGSYDGDDDVWSGAERKLFNPSITGSNYFGFGGDGIQLGPPITGSGYSSPDDVFIDINLVGIEWLMPWTRSSPRGPVPSTPQELLPD